MTSLSTKANRLYPSLPNIDDSLESHTAALMAVKDSIQTHERQDGNYLKSFVRFEELIDLGIIDSDGAFVLNIDAETGESSIALGHLSDVTLTSPSDNAVLGYDTATAEWIDQSAAQLGLSEVGHTHPPSAVTLAFDDLTDVDLTGAHDYDLLFRDGGDWKATQQLLQWDGADLHMTLGDLRFYAVGDPAGSALRQNFPVAGDVMLQVPGGNIYLQPGFDVFLDGATNLVVESDQYIQWLNTDGQKIDLLHFAPEAGANVEVGHVIKKIITGVSTTSGTYVDVTGAVITFAELEANEDYVVFVRAYIGAAGGNTAGNGCQLTKGGTLVPGSEMLYEPPWGLVVNLHGMLYYWGGIVNAGSSGDLQMRIKSGNGGVDTAFADKVTFMAIKLTDLVLNTNVFHDIDTTLVEIDDGSFPSAWKDMGASVTIGDGVSDYLVFGSIQIEDYTGGANNVSSRVSDGTNTQLGAGIGMGDFADTNLLGFCQLWKAPTADTTLQVQASTSGWPVDKKYASIIAVRVSAFNDYQGEYLAESGAFTGAPRDVINLNFNAAATATDYCLMVCGTGGTGAASDSPDPRILLDLNGGGDSTLAGTLDENFTKAATFHGPDPHWLISTDQSWTEADTIDAAFNVTTGSSGSAEWFDNFIIGFSWSLPTTSEYFDVGHPSYVTRMEGLTTRFYDPGLTDYVEFEHDGTDVLVNYTQTSRHKWRDGIDHRWYESGGVGWYGRTIGTTDVLFEKHVDILRYYFEDGDGNLYYTQNFGGTNTVGLTIHRGNMLEFRGTTGANKVELRHDNVDFNFTAANTTDFNISGITNLQLAANLVATGTVTGSNLNVANWDAAYGWGDHGLVGYLTSETSHADVLVDGDIGVTVQAYDATYLVDADIGVNVQAYDATYLVDADIGVNVQAYDATYLVDADIGVTVQAYGAYLTSVLASDVNAESSTDGYVLTSDGIGNAAWEALSPGASELSDLSDANTTGMLDNDLMYWLSGVLVRAGGKLTFDGNDLIMVGDGAADGRIVLPGNTGDATKQTLAFGSVGFNEVATNELTMLVGASPAFKFGLAGFDGMRSSSAPRMEADVGTIGQCAFQPNKSDSNTGINSSSDSLMLIAGGVQGMKVRETSFQILHTFNMVQSITASTTQTQGQQTLISSYNEVEFVANANDVITLPRATGDGVGRVCIVVNTSDRGTPNDLQVFPFSGERINNLATNASIVIPPGRSLHFIGSSSQVPRTFTALQFDTPPTVATTAALVAIANDINVRADKVEGYQVFNSTTGLPVWALGSADGDLWVDATGATAHTPA